MARLYSAALFSLSLLALILFPSTAGADITGRITRAIANDSWTRADISAAVRIEAYCATIQIIPPLPPLTCYYKPILTVYDGSTSPRRERVVWNPFGEENRIFGEDHPGVGRRLIPSPVTHSVTLEDIQIWPFIVDQEVCLTVTLTGVTRTDSGGINPVFSREDNLRCKDLALAPKTKITRHHVSQSRDKAKVWFKGKNGDPPYTFRCKRDGKRYRRCDSPKTYRRLSQDRHRIKVKVIDSRGIADETPARWRFKIKRR